MSDTNLPERYTTTIQPNVILLDAHRPGWWCGIALCCACSTWCRCIASPGADLSVLECPSCGAHQSMPAALVGDLSGLDPCDPLAV